MSDSPPPLEQPVVDLEFPPQQNSRKRKREMDSDDEFDLENQRINIAKSADDINGIDKRERHNTRHLLQLIQDNKEHIAKLEARLNAQSNFFLARLAELQANAPTAPKTKKGK